MFIWTAVEQEAFDTLRERLKNAPFMEYPNDTGVFTLETDASGQSIGFLLTITAKQGRWNSSMWRKELERG